NFIFGIHPVLEALDSKKKIEKVLFRQGLEGPQFRILLDKLRDRGIQVQFAPVEKLNYLTRSNHQGVIAFLANVDYVTLEEMNSDAEKSGTKPLILILDGISDVRNFGAIARSAECAGAHGIIVPAKGSATVSADSVKTSAGALLRIPVAKVSNIREAIYFLKESGYQIVATTERAEKSIYQTSFTGATAIILGSEERGVSGSSLTLSDIQVKIPMAGSIGSLNVSAAASVILFEVLRQRIV
ncbi:MAG: 23S rRNA (guanosine(2251)-2'-O)-methyltransferase RlmB, partial [Bacteroidales bacterium]|nr:23S rRNA (guanosine(2251)-2'-O)-methyltransferase RlmB [Bacteroidales bacterium]